MRPGTSCGPTLAKTISIRAASCASRASRATRRRIIARGWRLAAIRSRCSSRRRLSARWPFLEPGTFRYAYFSPEGGALHCRRIAAGLARWLRGNGANVYENSKVVCDRRAKRAASSWKTARRSQADRIVVTAGAWVLKLFPELGGALKTYRTALAYVEPPADLKAAWEAAPVILDVGGKTDGYMIPPVRRRRNEIRLGPAQGADQRRRLESRAGEGEGEAIRNLFSPPIARIDEYG